MDSVHRSLVRLIGLIKNTLASLSLSVVTATELSVKRSSQFLQCTAQWWWLVFSTATGWTTALQPPGEKTKEIFQHKVPDEYLLFKINIDMWSVMSRGGDVKWGWCFYVYTPSLPLTPLVWRWWVAELDFYTFTLFLSAVHSVSLYRVSASFSSINVNLTQWADDKNILNSLTTTLSSIKPFRKSHNVMR